MRWFIIALIYVSTCFAQPDGPFLITSVEGPLHISDAKVVVDQNGIAHVFYARTNYTASAIEYVTVRAADGEVLTQPLSIFEADSETVQLDDAALDENLNPVVVTTVSRGISHWLVVLRRSNETWTETSVAHVEEYFTMPCGLSHSNFTGSRIVLASSSMLQIVTSETGNACPGFPEPYSIPIVCFFESVDNYDVYPLWDFEGFMWPSSLRAYSYSADSLHVWTMSYMGINTRLAVGRDGLHSVVASYDCQYGDLAGMRVGVDEFIHVNGMNLCIPPCYTLQRISADSCNWVGEVHTFLGTTPSASVYESHGFVIPTFDYEHVELVRVDTEANLASSTGTIGWRDGDVNIENASTGVSAQGLICAVWGDHNSNSGTDRLWLASCDWLTPLDAREAPAPVPQSISLSTYPNPFNSSVRIDYELPHASDTRVSIYNTLGEEVATLFNGHTNAGTHMLSWSPNSASGVYFVKLASGEFVTSRKILYIR